MIDGHNRDVSANHAKNDEARPDESKTEHWTSVVHLHTSNRQFTPLCTRQNSVSKELQSDKQLTLSSLIAADTDDWENADSRQSTRTANDMLHCMYSFHTTDDWVCWTYVCLCVYLTGVQPAGALMNPTTWVCQLDTLPLLIMKKSVNLSLSTTTREIICIGGYYH